MQILEACKDLGTLGAILFIKNLVSILCIVTPILLLLMLTIDFVLGTIKGDTEKTSGIVEKAVKRIIFAALIFFIPTIVNAFMSLIGEKTNYSDCYNRANSEVIEQLTAEAREKENLKKKYNEEQVKQIIKARETKQKELEKFRTQAIKVQNSTNPTENSMTEDMYNKENSSGAEAIATTAEALAWPKKPKQHNYTKCYTKWSQLKGEKPTEAFMTAYDKERKGHFKTCSSKYGPGPSIGASCDIFIATVIRYSGYDKSVPWGWEAQYYHYFKNATKKWKKVSKAKRGDVCINSDHVMIYLGSERVAQANLHNKRFGHVTDRRCGSGWTIYRPTS
jgi:hypothetical protein